MFTFELKSGKIVKVDYVSGNKPCKWTPSGRHYVVTVKVGRKSVSFDFWDSYHNAQNRIAPDMRGAVACWAGDATIELYDQYKDIEVTDAKTVKACIKALKDARHLGFTDDDLQELSDY